MAISGLFNIGNISNNIGNFSNIQNIKKGLEEKNQERAKIYGYIGMEAYNLYLQGKLNTPEFEIYFEKLDDIEKVIAELENQKKDLEEQGKKTLTCSCGTVLSSKDRFCYKCGNPVEQKNNICECGQKVEEGMTFCPKCGNRIGKIEKIEFVEEVNYKECICGARIQEGQFMCMECGRKIEF